MVIGTIRRGWPLVQIGSEYPLNGEFDEPGDVVARARHENFPVASRLLPRDARQQLMAIYGFARLADDIGDEAQGDRLAQLDWLEAELELASSGRASHAVLRRLTPVLRRPGSDLAPYRCLIEANRMDQRVRRYDTFEDLVGYCMLSAAPVGRLVLSVFGAATPERMALSDNVCIGLQLVEHLQDVGEDARADRVYLPQVDLDRFGCTPGDLLGSSSGPALRNLVAMQAERALGLLVAGGPLARQLARRPGIAVAGFTAGGIAAVDAIARADYDVLSNLCRPRPLRLAARMVGVLAGPRRAEVPA
ncbi:MAG: squalene synthase HpnC [Acidimicrobiales bacterium]